MYVVPIISA
ncbi:Hypothetical protein SSCIU_00871 [Mammaliicoccus sciuri]|nr:Hypothetical protein SSCIU_00871 [Mammaliicoccus sciuri]